MQINKNDVIKNRITYYDAKKEKYVEVWGKFDYPYTNSNSKNFDNWLYSRKLETMSQSLFADATTTTVDLITKLRGIADSYIVDLGTLDSLFVKTDKNLNSAVEQSMQELVSRFLGLFEVKEIFEFSSEEYETMIRAAESDCFPQPITSERMQQELNTIPTNSKVIARFGYQPELAQQVQKASQTTQQVVPYQKINRKVVS